MSSDFCIKCDKELSVYCGPCMDEARAELERLRWLAELLEALEALLADHDKYCEHGSFESADAARAAIAKVRATEGKT